MWHFPSRVTVSPSAPGVSHASPGGGRNLRPQEDGQQVGFLQQLREGGKAQVQVGLQSLNPAPGLCLWPAGTGGPSPQGGGRTRGTPTLSTLGAKSCPQEPRADAAFLPSGREGQLLAWVTETWGRVQTGPWSPPGVSSS